MTATTANYTKCFSVPSPTSANEGSFSARPAAWPDVHDLHRVLHEGARRLASARTCCSRREYQPLTMFSAAIYRRSAPGRFHAFSFAIAYLKLRRSGTAGCCGGDAAWRCLGQFRLPHRFDYVPMGWRVSTDRLPSGRRSDVDVLASWRGAEQAVASTQRAKKI